VHPMPPSAAHHVAAKRDLIEEVLEALPAGVAVLRVEDPDDPRFEGPRVVLANSAFARFHASPSPAEGRSPEDLWPDEEGLLVRTLVEHAARGDAPAPERIERSGAGPVQSFVAHAAELGPPGRREVLLVLWDASASRDEVAFAERARARAEALASVAAELNRQVDAVSVVRVALGRAVALAGGRDGAVWLLEGAATLRGFVELSPMGREGAELRLATLSRTAQAIAERRPLWLERAAAAGGEAAWLDRLGAGGSLIVPVFQEERCVGVTFVDLAGASPPEPEDIAVVEAIAGQCAIALARARSYEAERAARARAEAAEAVTRRIAQRLALMQELTAALSSAHDRAEVVRIILDKGVAAMGARAGTIRIAQGDDLVLLDAFGAQPGLLRSWTHVPIEAALPSCEAFRLGQPLFVSTAAELVDRWPDIARSTALPGNGAWAAVPLAVDDRPFGVLGLGFPERREFDLEERAFIASLAGKCASALDRARLYEAERELRAEAERIGLLQEQLLAVVGHDLRTPLSSIAMGTNVLFRRGGLDERQAQTLTRMAASAERMSGIIRDLLDFSRARQGTGIPILRGPVDLHAVAARAILEMQAIHPQHEIALAAEPDATLEGDEARLLQVVSNLVGNAVQHGAQQSPVSVRIETGPEALLLQVRNEGPPIDPGLLPTIFEPFRRGAARAPGGGSIGLGLFIVREIVRAHGGSVEVCSKAGEGTTFSVRLPRAG